MKRIFFTLTILIAFASCQNKPQNTSEDVSENTASEPVESTTKTKYESLDAGEFNLKMMQLRQYNMVDVRTPKEFQTGHIPKAKNIDVNSEEFEQKVAELERDKPIFVYCRSGGRSKKAASKLEEMGFERIIELDGGITSWREADFEVSHSL